MWIYRLGRLTGHRTTTTIDKGVILLVGVAPFLLPGGCVLSEPIRLSYK
ncbi:hypothetical protein EniLVp02_0204 [Vibrio phage EniLVp02]